MPVHHDAFCQSGDKSQALRLLASSSWFTGLPAALQASLQALGRSQVLPAGGYLFLQGDPADGLYCVLQGSLLIGSSSAMGKNSVLARLTAGQWFGEVALFDHGPRTHDAHSDGGCLLWHVPLAALLAWLAGWPQGWYHIGQLMAGKTRQLMSGLAQQTLLSPEARLAQRLLLLAGSGPTVSLSQEALASATGISRQTCNAILGQLADAGLIRIARKQLTLLDRPALQDIGKR
jgi:CRP-like cAMP-binding protein